MRSLSFRDSAFLALALVAGFAVLVSSRQLRTLSGSGGFPTKAESQKQADAARLAEKIDGVRKDLMTEILRMQELIARLDRAVSNAPEFAQALSASGHKDEQLVGLVKQQRQTKAAEVRAANAGARAEEMAALRRRSDYLQTRTQERAQGVLLGMKVREAAMRRAFADIKRVANRPASASAAPAVHQ